jgi:uncharacterized protein YciI
MGKQSYVIMLRPANNYGTEGTEEKISEHFQYLQSLLRDGILTMAGRFSEVLIGLVMIDADSKEAAHDIMRNDPAVKAGVFHAAA